MISETDSLAVVLPKLRALLDGSNLHELALAHGVKVGTNKGWAGQALERIAGLSAGSRQRRDGCDFELKSTSLVRAADGIWQPKETIKITVMNPQRILEETFEASALWEKLSRLLLVGCHHEAPDRVRVVAVRAFDLDDPALVDEARAYWEEIRAVVCAGEIADYNSLGTSDGLLQLRPTGNRHNNSRCPITGRLYQAQAFYGTKRLLKRILELE